MLGTDVWTIQAARTIQWQWNADSVLNTDTAPYIGGFLAKCKTSQTTTPAPAPTIVYNQRVEGLLIGTSDILYFDVVQPAGEPMLLTMDDLTQATADLDLYASATVAQPDAQSATWVSQSTASHEALDIPAPTANRTVHVGVYAYNGTNGGHFALHAHLQSARASVSGTTWGIPALTATNKTNITATMKNASAGMLAASNGNIFFRQFTFFDTPGNAGCDPYNHTICLAPASTEAEGSASPSSEGFGNFCLSRNGWNNPTDIARRLFVHEAGHAVMSLWDEYDTDVGTSCAPNSSNKVCGHSIMAENGSANYSDFYCSIDHCLDGQVSEYAGCTAGHHSVHDTCNGYRPCCNSSTNNWSAMEAGTRVPAGPHFGALQLTPDPTHYFENDALKGLVTVSFQ